MSATALISVEEYLARTEKPYCEYVDGVLHPKAMPTLLHVLLQKILMTLLDMQGLRSASELTVRLSPTKYFVPDVVAAPILRNPYPTEPVTLCIEILSPSDRVGAMLAKCEEYHAWGVPYCWIVDPENECGWEYHAGNRPEPIQRGGTLTAGAVNVRLEELFSKVHSELQ